MLETYKKVLSFYKNDFDMLELISSKMNMLNNYVTKISENNIKSLALNEEAKDTLHIENDVWSDILNDAVVFLNRVYNAAGCTFFTGNINDKKQVKDFALNVVNTLFVNRKL